MSVSFVRRPDAGDADSLCAEVMRQVAQGHRFAALLGRDDPATGATLTALLADENAVTPISATLLPGQASYPAWSPRLPAAFWYERAVHDLVGLVPDGHPRLEPLVLPQHDDTAARPRPGVPTRVTRIEPDESALPALVSGPGVFTIPHGPVRSGVFESVEYLVETPGEDIPLLRIRPYYKHRGLQKRFEGMSVADALVLAERVEGIASVAHALAFAHAVETIVGVDVPRAAGLVRVLHAELERVANHLDVLVKLTDAAGLAVATARFGLHKENVLRLVGELCGSRFGRGVVAVGGVPGLPRMAGGEAMAALERLERDVESDIEALLDTSSFLDRVRTAGPLDPDLARTHGALGPVGRGSGSTEDARVDRPYDAYRYLTGIPIATRTAGDAQARLEVRVEEIDAALYLAQQAVGHLSDIGDRTLRTPWHGAAGLGVGWAEAPQGEVLYLVEVDPSGCVTYCAPRSASFHNLALFPATFQGDILTDFPFIEASFGLSIAGVVM